MKKLLFLFFACSMMHISAQDLSTMAKSDSSSGNSMIENLAADQVKSFTKKLNLNEKQQEQVSGLMVSLGADKLMGSSDNTDRIQSALLSDESFQKEMGSILDEKQMETMKTYIPK